MNNEPVFLDPIDDFLKINEHWFLSLGNTYSKYCTAVLEHLRGYMSDEKWPVLPDETGSRYACLSIEQKFEKFLEDYTELAYGLN